MPRPKFEYVYLYSPYLGYSESFLERDTSRRRLERARDSRLRCGQRCGAIVLVECPPRKVVQA